MFYLVKSMKEWCGESLKISIAIQMLNSYQVMSKFVQPLQAIIQNRSYYFCS